jgi:hypothetical protein
MPSIRAFFGIVGFVRFGLVLLVQDFHIMFAGTSGVVTGDKGFGIAHVVGNIQGILLFPYSIC